MIRVNYAEFHQQDYDDECHYSECHYAECLHAKCRGAILILSILFRFSHFMFYSCFSEIPVNPSSVLYT